LSLQTVGSTGDREMSCRNCLTRDSHVNGKSNHTHTHHAMTTSAVKDKEMNRNTSDKCSKNLFSPSFFPCRRHRFRKSLLKPGHTKLPLTISLSQNASRILSEIKVFATTVPHSDPPLPPSHSQIFQGSRMQQTVRGCAEFIPLRAELSCHRIYLLADVPVLRRICSEIIFKQR